MTTVLFILGVASVCAGAALIYPPAAFIVAGVALAGFAVAVEAGASPEPTPEQTGGDS